MAVELDLFAAFATLVLGSVEEVEGGDGVGEEPEDEGEGEFGEGDDQDDGVGDELEHVDFDALAFGEFEACEVAVVFLLVEVDDPLGVVPEIFGSLHEGVLGLLQDEFGLQQQGFLAIREEFVLQFLHLFVVQQAVVLLVEETCGGDSQQSVCQHEYLYKVANL